MAALTSAVLAPAATGQERAGKLGSCTSAGLLNVGPTVPGPALGGAAPPRHPASTVLVTRTMTESCRRGKSRPPRAKWARAGGPMLPSIDEKLGFFSGA